MFSPRIQEVLSRSSLLIAYLLLVAGVVVGFVYMQNITDRIELEGMVRANENCEATNDSLQVLTGVLDALVEPREGDEPGDYEERQRLREQVNPLIQPRECPPGPPAMGAE